MAREDSWLCGGGVFLSIISQGYYHCGRDFLIGGFSHLSHASLLTQFHRMLPLSHACRACLPPLLSGLGTRWSHWLGIGAIGLVDSQPGEKCLFGKEINPVLVLPTRSGGARVFFFLPPSHDGENVFFSFPLSQQGFLCCPPRQKSRVERLKAKWNLWEGFRESSRCSRDTYPESYITEHTSIQR